MPKVTKIGLFTAILININIIIGAGVFLNIKPIIHIAGPFGFLGYPLGALILLPFVISLAKLAQLHPVSGGLYVYSKKHLHPFIGFLSGWSFFIGKSVSAAFLAYSFTVFTQNQISCLKIFPTLPLTCFVVFSIILLNIAGAHVGGKIQFLFVSIKIVPILFTFTFGLSLLQPSLFEPAQFLCSPIISTIPITLYALVGFEVICAIGHLIKDGRKNLLKIILIPFTISTIIFTIFQAIVFGVLGSSLTSHSEPFLFFALSVCSSYPIIARLINAFVFTSVIAGSFAILTSNCWNLHALAKDDHLPFKTLLTKVSTTNVPWASLIFEGIIACLILVISKNQIALQSMSVFGVVCSFLFSALAAFQASKKNSSMNLHPSVPIIGLLGCIYILFLCFQKIFAAGISIPFLVVLLTGIIISLVRKKYIYE